MPAAPVTFILIHGYFHSADCWKHVAAELEAGGYRVCALDLPGAGIHVRSPVSYTHYDAEALKSEPSPSLGITQPERTAVVLRAIEEEAAQGRRVIVVSHSAGGYSAVPAVEQAYASVAAVIFLSSVMLPAGLTPFDFLALVSMADTLVPSCFIADPATIGAARVDWRSQDATYQALLKETFAADAEDEALAQYVQALHCDEPVSTFTEPSRMTAERFGSVPRVYIRLGNDRAMTPAGQDWLVEQVDAAMGNKTLVHRVESAHTPMLTQPHTIAQLLQKTADSVRAGVAA